MQPVWSKVAGACALVFCLGGTAVAGDGVVRIGVLNDQSGVFADSTGNGSTIAARMAAEDFGGKAAGMPIEIIAADHQNRPDIGAGIARRWFDLDHVDAIADLGNSAVALAVAEIARDKNKAVLISAGGTTALTGKSCSPNTVQWTYDTWSQSNAIGTALVKKGLKKWFFLTADYTFGYNLRDETSKVVLANGGQVVGSVAHPLNSSDFSSYLLQAQASKADVIALANGGNDTANSIKQAQEFRITKGNQVLVGLSMMITDIKALGLAAAQGLYVTETFYWDRTPESRAWSERWAKRNNGRYPTMMQAGVYGAVLHYLKAVQAVGSVDDGAKVVAEMKKLPTDDPLFGKGYILPNGRKIHDAYVFQIKSPEESKSDWDYYKLVSTVPGKEAFLTLEQSGCKLTK
ncbi:ABC transporter permease [Pseudolabrys taiwanensis]|uniref:ABC transporter permease n=1 Tax=Pseudolabrys taiwanensis TaxID=331696 RepID=A0A345ZUX6_9HYPH|nr:ABC transporter substrate-binding protein [Pseudolabrys taiwanensis]AXK80723.1 ABC transporter permease [Pseudolabrys taiwanensis]